MMNRLNQTKISLAAVPYFWSKDKYVDFYQQVASLPVDIVYLGETVCSKRRSMKMSDWIGIANLLSAAGKQVVLSTLTLLEAESELGYLSKIAAQKDFWVEANDLAAIQVASEHQSEFVAGCAINIYNNSSLSQFHKMGMKRWVVPVELGRDDLAPMIEYAHHLSIELEYQVFGRMPLAYSARCFTARHHQLTKDQCQFKCLHDEQGILVKTQEGAAFAQINGIQTQSAKVSNLLNQTSQLIEQGIDILRVVPVSAEDTLEVVKQLKQILEQQNTVQFNSHRLSNDYQFCNGYWFQIEGMSQVD